jgi:hypothetical protein
MREQSINEIINDNSMKVSSERNLYRINDNSMSKSSPAKIAYVEYVADKLVDIFKAPQSRKFFLKCAWHLSENTIWSAVEESRKKCIKTPLALFIYLCNNALQERPIEK